MLILEHKLQDTIQWRRFLKIYLLAVSCVSFPYQDVWFIYSFFFKRAKPKNHTTYQEEQPESRDTISKGKRKTTTIQIQWNTLHGPHTSKDVGCLISRSTGVDNGPSNMMTKSLNTLSDGVLESPGSRDRILEPGNSVGKIRLEQKMAGRRPMRSSCNEKAFTNSINLW